MDPSQPQTCVSDVNVGPIWWVGFAEIFIILIFELAIYVGCVPQLNERRAENNLYPPGTTYFSLLTSKQIKIWLLEEQYKRTRLGIKSMNDAAFNMLHTLEGKPCNTTDYPWCYDPLFMNQYQDGMGYKPAFQRNFENEDDSVQSDYILRTLYGELTMVQKPTN